MKSVKIASLLVATFVASQSAQAAVIVTLVEQGLGAQSLNRLNTAAPGTSNLVSITGLGVGETLLGLDFRPATGVLYGLGSGSNLYTVNTDTGVSTIVGSGFGGVTLSPTNYGFDFNPTIDRIRIVSTNNSNSVANPNTGTAAPFTPVFYNTGDVNVGMDPNLVHHAYTNNFAGALTSQLFGIDSSLNILATQANSAGTLQTVGAIGFDIDELGGFDIDGSDGIAYAALSVGGTSGLYTINLATGQATSLGALSGTVSGLAVIPEPSSALLLSLGAFAALRRNRKR